MKVLKIKFKKLKIWRIIWEWKFWKLNLEIEILENYFKIKVLKIGILGNYLRMIFFFKYIFVTMKD